MLYVTAADLKYKPFVDAYIVNFLRLEKCGLIMKYSFKLSENEGCFFDIKTIFNDGHFHLWVNFIKGVSYFMNTFDDMGELIG